jgi:hypothetical protein
MKWVLLFATVGCPFKPDEIWLKPHSFHFEKTKRVNEHWHDFRSQLRCLIFLM